MPLITTTLDSAKLIESIELILKEWLTSAIDSSDVEIRPYIVQNTEAATMKAPWCEYLTTIANTGTTGGGALGTEARFKFASVEIAYRVSKTAGSELDLVLLGDKVDNYFRQPFPDGRASLGRAGLKNAVLDGPKANNAKPSALPIILPHNNLFVFLIKKK